jgi:hypothetical protein
MERYRFFDSVDGEDERQYTADEFAEYFRQFIRNGIFTGGDNLKVETDEQDMKVFIKPGYAFIEGYLYKIDTEPLVMQHNIADPSLNRIDRIVIRLDKTLENRYVKAFILEGTPAETPQVPELTRNSNVYEISLAQIEIIAGKSFIESYQITDERLNNDVCGITTHLFEQVDTTDIFNEWQNYLDFKKNESNVSYADFVDELQSKLNAFQQTWDNWVENKISEPAGEFYAEWKAWFNELQDTTNLVTKSQFDGFKATKGNPSGIATLDEEAQVPSEQLENIQYLKTFYGRSVQTVKLEDQYTFNKVGVEFNLFDFYRYSTTNQYRDTGTNIPELDFKVLLSSDNNAYGHTYPDYYRLSAYGSRYVIGSNRPFDLTDVDYIEFKYYTSGSTSGYCYMGIQKELDDVYTTAGYDYYVTESGNSGSASSLSTLTLDVREVTGEYYLKLTDWATTTAWRYLHLYGVSFVGENLDLEYKKATEKVELKSDKLSAIIDIPNICIPPGFLDWYSLNALVDTPNGTSARFDIYDNYGNLLKENVKNGETFRGFTNPIIQPRVTLTRDSVEIASPTFSWLSMGMRGSENLLSTSNGSDSVVTITVDDLDPEFIRNNASHVVSEVEKQTYFGSVSDGSDQEGNTSYTDRFGFYTSNLYQNNTATARAYYNYEGYTRLYCYTHDVDTKSYASQRSVYAYDLTNIESITFEYKLYGYVTGDNDIVDIYSNGFLGVTSNLDTIHFHEGSFYDKYILVSDITSGIVTGTLDVSALSGEHIIGFGLNCDDYSLVTDENRQLFLEVYNITIKNSNGVSLKINPSTGAKYLSFDGEQTQFEIFLPIIKAPENFLEWYSFNAMVDTPDGTGFKYDIFDNYGNLLKNDVKNGETFKDFAVPSIQPKVTFSKTAPGSDPPIFYSLSVGMRRLGNTRTWQKIGEIKLKIPTAMIDIDVPDFYNELRLIGKNMKTDNSTANFKLTFNHDTENNYNTHYISSGAFSNYSGSYASIGSNLISYGTNQAGTADITIINDKSADNTFYHFFFSGVSSYMGSGQGYWKVPNKIDSIQITPSNYNLAAGSIFELWGR